MARYIDKSALVAEIEKRRKTNKECMLGLRNLDYYQGKVDALNDTLSFIDTLEVKEVDIDKMLYFRRNIGFAYPEGASEYQKHLACYRQGIEDVLKAQKGE